MTLRTPCKKGYRGVVATMFLQAINAITEKRKFNKNTGLGAAESVEWLYSGGEGFGSVQWCCAILDYDYDVVIQKLEERWHHES